MKLMVGLTGLVALLINSPLSACDIVNKRDIYVADRIGVAGNCSNNGEKIECYEVGEYYGGLTCEGPIGTNSSYNLKNLIYAVCGCSPEDQERIDEQMDQELE
ncbi:hypothetical protein [Candidatus Methylomicrobium oryzae]|jgi:hypothetical protein|uniref:hypothetical protein n=1 Tax=Candidatus Methylomicrobium oryzae TaxID=2802053 RepID=UPI00192419BE|nr:hypothetical protein [Methylomicrobium sp. RS1]MBL1265570.1 hypothetical protein [Methylomicrobium sp. RS1]